MRSKAARKEAHDEESRRSGLFLQDAVLSATHDLRYDSSATRTKIQTEFTRRNSGKQPYTWQVNVTEAKHCCLALDCTVIAGTTMPTVMPLFVHPKKVVMIISPLNALEEDQAQRFRDMDLTAAAVNGETYDDKMHKNMQKGEVQVIVTSHEMCLQDTKFRELLSLPSFAKRICSVVVDEAHCVSQ
ncbi:P-loop containing nucleoside triphosphate hydrolase [Pleurotus pulmonarius]|nr:hypothetical protein EYR38_002052 [Pleurotus pulmonarius]